MSSGVLEELRRDEKTRQRIRRDLDVSLLVEAAAGTGKTTLLVDRLVSVLRSGSTTVDRIAAVTFTRKAAGELKLRLRQKLDEVAEALRSGELEGGERGAQSDLRAIEHAIEHLEEARIGTIHSFCADILRERPVEAGIDPGFQEVGDDEGPRLFARAFDRWIQDQLQEMPPGLRRALSVLALQRSFDGSTPLDRLRIAAWQLAEWRDFPAPWQRASFEREPMIDGLVEHVGRIAGYARRSRNSRDHLRVSLEPMVLLDDWIARGTGFPSGDAAERDYDALEARLMELQREMGRWNRKRKGRGKYAEALPREQVVAERDQLVEALKLFKEASSGDLAALLRDELQGALAAYEDVKQREGRLDFQDLILRARDLLRRDAEVRDELQQRITHLFVDEFQDTDPLQAEVLLLLAGDDATVDDWRRVRPVPGKLFLVGDPKQSIYRFRRADIQLYQRISSQLEAAGVVLLELSRSFRSVPPVQRLVNASFRDEMDGNVEEGSPRYIPLVESREVPEGRPSLIALPAPTPYGDWRRVNNKAIEACLPDTVGAMCQWLLEDSGWTVQDPETREVRSLRSSDICLLFRRFLSFGNDITRDYTRALESRGISHLLLGQRTFHRREEVETLRSALTAIEWPDDELALFSALRGSLYSFPDDQLLRFGQLVGGFGARRWRRHAERAAEEGTEVAPDLHEVGAVLLELEELHRRRNRRAVVETVQDLLARTRAHAGFAMRPAGHQVLANVDRVCDLARSYEVGGGRSFRGFVERLEEQAARPSSTDAAVAEEGAEGVRLMTVHSAKGLEFPVVILCDPTARLATGQPARTVDTEKELCAMRLLGWSPLELVHAEQREHRRDETEGLRVAYVAATRARDLLVVPAVGDGALEGSWISPLWKAIYPDAEAWRESEPAAGCPEFGDASVLERPIELDDQPEGSVRPGRHRFEDDAYDVVWWDPRTLPLGAPTNRGLWHEQLLAPAEGESSGSASELTHWQLDQERSRLNGMQTSFDVVAVTQLEELPPGGARPYEVVETTPQKELEGRPSGIRFGDLVHSVLQFADGSSAAADGERSAGLDVEATTRAQARTLGATDEEIAAAVQAVHRALASAPMRALADADQVLHESPFVLPLDDGRTLEGTFDLVALSDGEWTVIDFKTDVDLEARREHYERQLSWYLFALEKLTGQRGRAVLLRV